MLSMVRIPSIFHFIFGLKPQHEPFHICWYLCLKSCIEVNRPEKIYFHYLNEPHGPWWEKIKGQLLLLQLKDSATYFDASLYDDHEEGAFIKKENLQYAHQSDILRLQILAEYGGVYADIDTLFVKPYPGDFYEFPCLMGRENASLDPMTLCNAVIMAEKDSRFVTVWLQRMFEVFDGTWNRHSCIEPAIMSQELKDHIRLVSPEWFFHFTYSREDLISLFGQVSKVPERVCSIHMWNHLWWDERRTDFISFHGGHITEEFIQTVDNTYNIIARRYLNQ